MMLNGGMGKHFQYFIQQNLASGLVISFSPPLFAHMKGPNFEMTEWIAPMFTTKFARVSSFCSFRSLE